MQIQCVHCGKQYSLRDESVGSQFLCRSCKKLSPVAARAPEDSAVVAPLAPIAARPAEPAAAGPVETECQHCGKQYKLKSAAVGMQFKCKQCGGLTPVGASAPLPPPQPIKAASPSPPLAALPAQRALSAIPQAARPALAARPAAAAPRAARPVARTARPASAPPQALPAGLVEAELVAAPIDATAYPSPGMADLLNEASTPAAAPYGYAAAEARPLPPPPAPAASRTKTKRSSRVSFDGERIGTVLGGLFFIALGIGVAGLAFYGMQNGHRRSFRVLGLGVFAIISGFLMVLGRHNKD